MKPSDSSKILQTYFPYLEKKQIYQFDILKELYIGWNSKINLISRKDIDNFYIRHVLHSLSIAKYIEFEKGSKILDVGTGGGFPGIPLAIYFSNINFKLIDSIAKKIKVVNKVVSDLGLKNVISEVQRVEKTLGKYDFIISRAVTKLEKFCPWVEDKISNHQNNKIKNGIIYLKGGDLTNEIKKVSNIYNIHITEISNYFKDLFFDTKSIVYLNKK